MASETYHEPYDRLSGHTQDQHRAISSLMEELDAVDWYQQRIDETNDAELKRIIEHNRDEEKENAAMLLAWIRRRDVGRSEEHTSEIQSLMGNSHDVICLTKTK